MGKYHPASPDSYSYSESIPFSDCDTDCFSVANCIDDAIRLANTNIRISDYESRWQRTSKSDACAKKFASCVSKALRNRTPANLDREASSFVAGEVSASASPILNLAQRVGIAGVS